MQSILCWCLYSLLLGLSSIQSTSHCPTSSWVSHWIKHVQLDKKFLDTLCCGWKDKLIGISTDGASNMTGQYQGVVTYLCNNTPHLVYHVWCGAHQLDLVVQSATRHLLHGAFVQFVTNMTGNLRRQKNLILEMKTKCPRFTYTRWMSMAKVIH